MNPISIFCVSPTSSKFIKRSDTVEWQKSEQVERWRREIIEGFNLVSESGFFEKSELSLRFYPSQRTLAPFAAKVRSPPLVPNAALRIEVGSGLNAVIRAVLPGVCFVMLSRQ